MKFDTVFFIGPQGSGKGTQAKLLSSRLGFFYWEMGSILREVARSGSELGDRVRESMRRGELIGDGIVMSVVEERLADLPEHEGLIFDGMPRRLSQAEYVMRFLRENGHTEYATLFIDLKRDVSVDRLLKRAEAEGRADDTKEAIEFRLDQYYENTVPVVEYLRGRTAFREIDGHPPIESVTEAINHALGI